MRTLLIILAAIVSGSLFAQPFTPNLYYCKGDGLNVHYLISRVNGGQHITFTDASGHVFDARDEAVLIEETTVGKIVSVLSGTGRDEKTKAVSMIIPRIVLRSPDPEDSVGFKTLLLNTNKKAPLTGSDFTTGALDETTSKSLNCSAHFVHY